MTEKTNEVKSVELPKIWQILQLFSLQVFAGSFVAYVILSLDNVQKAIINGYGASNYAIILATFLFIGVTSGFLAGTKGLQLLIKLIRITKTGKDE